MIVFFVWLALCSSVKGLPTVAPVPNVLNQLADRLAPGIVKVIQRFNGPLSPFLKLTDAALAALYGKYTPDTKSSFDDEYDYIIVGAGSGGSALAGRLSEESCVKVLVLEAGPRPSFFTEIPIFGRFFYGSDIDWKIVSVPQENTAGLQVDRRVPISTGKTPGGSSTKNSMVSIRGNKKTFDGWAAGGATGWSYDDVLPYFLKMDGNRIKDFDNPTYHNKTGPLTAERPSYNPPYKKAVFEAATNEGYPIVDSNGETQYGFFDFAATMRDGRRCSAAKAYLIPADQRENLDIVVNALVTKVAINEDKRATGVLVEFDGKTYSVRARRDVIVSAGAMHTPQVLMLSGVGPRDQLEKFKIPVIVDLPVGKNFQDHPGIFMPFTIDDEPFLIKVLNPVNVAQYFTTFTGPLTSTDATLAFAFLSTSRDVPPDVLPDFQIYFLEGVAFFPKEQLNMKREEYNKYYGPHEADAFVWCISQIMNPKSRGTVTINSTNIKDPPLVDPNYFAEQKDFDDTVAGLQMCRDFHSNPAFDNLKLKIFSPAPCKGLENNNEFLPCLARNDVFSTSHPAGSAKMGAADDPDAVVDPELRVRGIKGLRVVDASIMPQITSGNTNVPTQMIGEKASDMIKKSINCRK